MRGQRREIVQNFTADQPVLVDAYDGPVRATYLRTVVRPRGFSTDGYYHLVKVTKARDGYMVGEQITVLDERLSPAPQEGPYTVHEQRNSGWLEVRRGGLLVKYFSNPATAWKFAARNNKTAKDA